MDWLLLYAFSLNLTLMIKIHFFCSAEEKTAGSGPFCGKAMVSFSCTKGWITVLSGGQGRHDEAMVITDDQYRMLMQGLEVVARHPITEVAKIPDLM